LRKSLGRVEEENKPPRTNAAVASEIDELVRHDIVFGVGNAGIRHKYSFRFVIAIDQIESVSSISSLLEQRLCCDCIHQTPMEVLKESLLRRIAKGKDTDDWGVLRHFAARVVWKINSREITKEGSVKQDYCAILEKTSDENEKDMPVQLVVEPQRDRS
jgi:hypothetical protein